MTRKPTNMRSWARSLWAGAVGGVMLGLLGGAVLITAIGDPPITIREAHETDGVVLSGGRLDLVFTIDRARQCPSITSRYLWRWIDMDGEQLRQFVPLGTSPSGITPVGENQRVMMSLAIPPDLAEGEWFYWSRTTTQCPGLFDLSNPAVHQAPDIPVRIVSHLDGAKGPQP